MILRDEFGGFAVDVRADGRWGIGAEILLHRGTQVARERHAITTTGTQDSFDTIRMPASSWLTRQGFEEAKSYYERLILQHPYENNHARATGALDFYPAMFGLWIYIVQLEGKLARGSLDSEISEDKELKEAEEIAAHLDRIMASPPFSDYGEMLRLRGMVALWIGDLQSPLTPAGHEDDHAMKVDRRPQKLSEADIKKHEQILVAKRFFEDAKKRGAELPSSIKSLLRDEDEEMPEEGGKISEEGKDKEASEQKTSDLEDEDTSDQEGTSG